MGIEWANPFGVLPKHCLGNFVFVFAQQWLRPRPLDKTRRRHFTSSGQWNSGRHVANLPVTKTKHKTQITKPLFLACGWYGALGRFVNLEMCHLRSLGKVANLKIKLSEMGVGFHFLASLTCCTCCRMIIRVGGWVCINVLDEHFSDVTEHVHVAHAGVWWSGGGRVCINVLDEHFPYVTEHVASKNQQVYQKKGRGVLWAPKCLHFWHFISAKDTKPCSFQNQTLLLL